MDDKTKKVENEESSETINQEVAEPIVETTEETAAKTSEEMAKDEVVTETTVEEISETVTEGANEPIEGKKNKMMFNAMIRAGAALLVAIALLAVSKFSVVDLIKGAKETDAVQDGEIGSFVKTQIPLIVGFVDAEKENPDSGEYALVPMGTKFVTVHFTKRYIESSVAIEKQTYNFINKNTTTCDNYVTVEGTIETLSEDMSAKMYDWFALNKDWMVNAGAIPNLDDNAEYLSDAYLEVDTVKGMSEVLVFVLTGLAGLCLLYIIVELVLMATGFYLADHKKKKAELVAVENDVDETEEESAEAQETSESTENDEENSSEDGTECTKDEENSGNNGCSETDVTEKSDIQEDK